MSNKRLYALAFACVWLAACGGGSNEDEKGSDPGVLLLVNGSRDVSLIETTVYERTNTNFNANLERCLSATTNLPLYDNYADITADGQDDYCDQSIFVINPAITVRVSYINSTYDPLPLSYTGVGMVVKVYDNNTDAVVWHSDMSLYLRNRLAGLDDYDPTQVSTTTLGPQETYPPARNGTYLTFNFLGDGNFNDALGEDLVAGSEMDQTNFLLPSLCSPFVVEDVLPVVTNPDTGEVTVGNKVADRPLCQFSIPVPVGTYRMEITTNFNDQIETREVTVVINPAS